MAGARRERKGGFARTAKSEHGDERVEERGGGVAPAASLLFSPLRPLIDMETRDICKMPGCQIKPNENLADFFACLSGMSKTKPHGGFHGRFKSDKMLRSI